MSNNLFLVLTAEDDEETLECLRCGETFVADAHGQNTVLNAEGVLRPRCPMCGQSEVPRKARLSQNEVVIKASFGGSPPLTDDQARAVGARYSADREVDALVFEVLAARLQLEVWHEMETDLRRRFDVPADRSVIEFLDEQDLALRAQIRDLRRRKLPLGVEFLCERDPPLQAQKPPGGGWLRRALGRLWGMVDE